MNETDEMHSSLDWASIRPEMESLCGLIRIFTMKGATTPAMAATCTEKDVYEMNACHGLRDEDLIVLRATPIEDHV